MIVTTMTSREFEQNIDRAKRAAEAGPVFILSEGVHTHVLLTMAAYDLLSGARGNVADLLAMPPGGEDIEFEPPRSRLLIRPAEFD